MKMLQTSRGLAQVTNRQHGQRFPGLLLLKIRAAAASQARYISLKRTLRIEAEKGTDTSHPVKITHLKQTAPRVRNYSPLP